jgi:hypothetical protein
MAAAARLANQCVRFRKGVLGRSRRSSVLLVSTAVMMPAGRRAGHDGLDWLSCSCHRGPVMLRSSDM